MNFFHVEHPRPFPLKHVWRLMVHGCNAAEIAHTAGVSRQVALAMMAQAMPKERKRSGVLRKSA